MKKTLITLAALAMASVAQADIFTDNLKLADWDVTAKETYDTTFSNGGAYTLTFALDWNAVVSEIPSLDNKTLIQMGSTPSDWFKSAVDLNVNGTDITVSARVDYSGGWHDFVEITFDKDSFCIDGLLKLSVSFDGTDTYTLSAMKADENNTIVSASADNPYEDWNLAGAGQTYGKVLIGHGISGDVVDSMLAFDTVLDEAGLKAASKAIPEPTTATLSLLALAGLAARRRRK